MKKRIFSLALVIFIILGLKEMFNAELVVINNSNTDIITDCKAKISLPDGLSLADMISGSQSNEQFIGYVGHSESASSNWYIRGDMEGEYDISAKVTGVMKPFDDIFESKNMLNILKA